MIVNSAVDRPWSQYFCCMLAGNARLRREHPIATKRVLRAILKAADLCVAEPERVAQRLVDGGFTPRYDYALQTLTESLTRSWREFDPEDTMRFYALRLHEVGHDQVEPEEDHRRRHRLALPERAQARAEGVKWSAHGSLTLTQPWPPASHKHLPASAGSGWKVPGRGCRAESG